MQCRKEEAQISIFLTSLRNICQIKVIPMHSLLQDKQVGPDSSGTILLERTPFYFCKLVAIFSPFRSMFNFYSTNNMRKKIFTCYRINSNKPHGVYKTIFIAIVTLLCPWIFLLFHMIKHFPIIN